MRASSSFISAIGAFILFLPIGAFAQAESASIQRGEREQDEPSEDAIVVTGSLIRGLPKEYVASPVFTYGKEDIAQSGAGSLSEYILTIPQNFTGDLSDFGSSAAQIGTTLGAGTTYNQFDGFSGFALRGLASDATLTLLNGRRMPSVGMIESPTVSVIPSALIERIDIIPDGASATYGADAVAGVVNIVTRKIVDGAELRVRGSTTTETGSKNWEVSALAGHSWGTGNIYGMAMYQGRDAFVQDPILVSDTLLQITQLPNEELSGFYAGISQDVGDFTFSVDGSRFRRDRNARTRYLNDPDDNNFFDTKTTGYSAYGNVRWQGDGSTAVDLNVDYGRTETESFQFRGVPPYAEPYSAYENTNTLFVAELRGQTALAELPAGPLIVAVGAQYRAETLDTDATIFFHRAGGTRKAKSIFSEVNVPVVGPEQDVPLVRSLTLSAAARYEDLGFDDALAPKVGLRWQIDRSIAIRATYARSFLAPRFRDTIGIAEQVSFWNYPYAFLDPADQNPDLPDGNALVMFRAGANPDLETQDADTITVGVDFTPTFLPGLNVDVGYYRVKISGRVVRPSQDDSVTVPDLQVFNTLNPDPAMLRDILNGPDVFRIFSVFVPYVADGGVAFFDGPDDVPGDLISRVQVIGDIRTQNYAVEFTDGFDAEIGYRADLLGGTMDAHLTGQYILNLDLTAGGTAISRLDGYAQPADLRLNGSLTWGRDGISIGSVVNYVDGFTDNRSGADGSDIGSYTTASFFLGFDLGQLSSSRWSENSELLLFVANAFDSRPPRVEDSVLGFDPYNNPPNPRTVGLILSKKFR